MVKKSDIARGYSLPKSYWRIVKSLVVALIVLAILGVSWFAAWRTGWPGYISAVVKCDGKPVVGASSFLVKQYVTPADNDYHIPGGDGYRTYFCSEKEAIQSGYKHKPF